jgi:hypothetical protein
MVAPAPVNPEVEQRSKGPTEVSFGSAQDTSRFLRTFGFHVLAVLLGIALAFM